MSSSNPKGLVDREVTLRRARWVFGHIKMNDGLRLSHLAKAIGTHPSTISRKLRGQIVMTNADWDEIVKVLEMTIEELDHVSKGSSGLPRAAKSQSTKDREAALVRFLGGTEPPMSVFFPLEGTPDVKFKQLLRQASALRGLLEERPDDVIDKLIPLVGWGAPELVEVWCHVPTMLDDHRDRSNEMQGSWLVVFGPRGSGKTTLARYMESVLPNARLRPKYVTATELTGASFDLEPSEFEILMVDDLHEVHESGGIIGGARSGRPQWRDAAKSVVSSLRDRLSGSNKNEELSRVPKAVFFVDPTYLENTEDIDFVFSCTPKTRPACMFLQPVSPESVEGDVPRWDFKGEPVHYQSSKTTEFLSFLKDCRPRPWLASFAAGKQRGRRQGQYSKYLSVPGLLWSLDPKAELERLFADKVSGADRERLLQELWKARKAYLLDALESLAPVGGMTDAEADAARKAMVEEWVNEACSGYSPNGAPPSFERDSDRSIVGNPLVTIDQRVFKAQATLRGGMPQEDLLNMLLEKTDPEKPSDVHSKPVRLIPDNGWIEGLL